MRLALPVTAYGVTLAAGTPLRRATAAEATTWLYEVIDVLARHVRAGEPRPTVAASWSVYVVDGLVVTLSPEQVAR